MCQEYVICCSRCDYFIEEKLFKCGAGCAKGDRERIFDIGNEPCFTCKGGRERLENERAEAAELRDDSAMGFKDPKWYEHKPRGDAAFGSVCDEEVYNDWDEEFYGEPEYDYEDSMRASHNTERDINPWARNDSSLNQPD